MKEQTNKQNTINIEIEKSITDNYTIISNQMIYDNKLSYELKGFLLMLLALPPKWKLTADKTSNFFNINERTFRRYIKKLKELGYIETKGNTKNTTYIIHIESIKGYFNPKKITYYNLKQLNYFLGNPRTPKKYLNLIKKAIEQTEKGKLDFNKLLESITDTELKAEILDKTEKEIIEIELPF